jgi:hypothetical protein
MAGRILTLQRQARELGRLRTGYTDTSGAKSRPVRSDTWILTSHSENYVRAAAEEFGGTPEKWQPLGAGAAQWRVITEQNAIDAIMPPGDPLSQTNELWSGGGCQRRCDGVTEQLSDSPCLCLAQHGDAWHERPKGTVCSTTTRLNVILPDLPDVGIYRVETHSFYAANEIAATVDLIRHATQGEAAVPIRLRIEQRQRVAHGQTKKFPVVVVELRGATAGQILGGQVPGITARPAIEAAAPAAIEAGSNESARAVLLSLIDGATTRDELLAIRADAKTAGVNIDRELAARAEALGVAQKPPADPNALWTQILATAPDGWTTGDVEVDFERATGVAAENATSADMERYLARATS